MTPYALRIPHVTEDRRNDRSARDRSGSRAVKRLDHKAARRDLAADLRNRCEE